MLVFVNSIFMYEMYQINNSKNKLSSAGNNQFYICHVGLRHILPPVTDIFIPRVLPPVTDIPRV
jgi:hypothetical protein